MARLAFCDYHNMIAILEKYEHNQDFHPIVDFVKASHIRYALTFNPTVYVSHIRQFWSTARIKTTEEGTKILATVDGKLRTVSESSIRRNLKLNNEAGIIFLSVEVSHPYHHAVSESKEYWVQRVHIATALVCLATNRVYNFPKMIFDGMVKNVNNKVSKNFIRARIAQSSALPTTADEPAYPLRDGSQDEVCPTVTGLVAGQDRANITKTSTLPSDSTPRVTSLVADEGRRSLDEREEVAEKGSDDTAELVTVLTSLDAATALSSGVDEVPTGSSSIPTAGPSATGIPTGSGMVPTASLIFTTATETTPYTRRKGKEKMVESDTPKKKKLQEQIDVQVARELEKEMERDAQRMNEQIARDAKIVRIHTEEELQMMIDGLDENNETIAKYLQEYHQFAAELPIGRRIELISDLVKYQDNYAKVLKFQTRQRKSLSKKQQRDFYMPVLKSQAGWKARHFKGMTLEEIKEKFDPVWKQFQDFIPIGSKEEAERFKRKGLRLEQDSTKKVKTTEEVPKEKLKEMMELIPVEEVYVEALQVKHPIIDWEHLDREDLNQLWALVKETLNIRPAANDKEKELWVELKRLYKPDVEDLLWTHTQNLMHALVEWKLYDTCGVHHMISKDQEMFMLVEKDYPLRKGLAIVMISYKLQVENYSQMANDLILKI
nr:hypothetical protein [Tanacetum cinerariifolium]